MARVAKWLQSLHPALLVSYRGRLAYQVDNLSLCLVYICIYILHIMVLVIVHLISLDLTASGKARHHIGLAYKRQMTHLSHQPHHMNFTEILSRCRLCLVCQFQFYEFHLTAKLIGQRLKRGTPGFLSLTQTDTNTWTKMRVLLECRVAGGFSVETSIADSIRTVMSRRLANPLWTLTSP